MMRSRYFQATSRVKVRHLGLSRRRLLQLLIATGAGAVTTAAKRVWRRQQQTANAQDGLRPIVGMGDDRVPRILIAEAGPRLAHLMGKGFGKHGFATVIAEDGEAVQRRVQKSILTA